MHGMNISEKGSVSLFLISFSLYCNVFLKMYFFVMNQTVDSFINENFIPKLHAGHFYSMYILHCTGFVFKQKLRLVRSRKERLWYN